MIGSSLKEYPAVTGPELTIKVKFKAPAVVYTTPVIVPIQEPQNAE